MATERDIFYGYILALHLQDPFRFVHPDELLRRVWETGADVALEVPEKLEA